MTLEVEEGGSASGSYFLRKDHKNIALMGWFNNAGPLNLCTLWSANKACDDIKLNLGANGQWQGSWTDSKGAAQVVRLEPLDVQSFVRPSLELPPPGADDVYDWALVADLSLQKDKEEKIQGRRLQWWLEPLSGVRLFRVEDGYPPATLELLNKLLAARHWEAITAVLNCGAINKPGERYAASITATPRLLGNSLFSVDIFERSECGDSHANVGNQPINVDVASGQVLSLATLLGLDKDKQEPADQGKWLVKTLTQLYPKQMAGDQAFFSNDTLWESAFWYATPKGIQVGPSYPENSTGPIPPWAMLPWSLVNAQRQSKGKKLP